MTAEEIMRKARSTSQYKEKHSGTSESAEDIMERARQKKFQSDVSKVDQSYLDSFQKDSNDFFSSTQVDVGWDNAGSLYQDSQKKLKDLDYRRSVISSWLASNKDILEPEGYKSMSEYMNLFTSGSGEIMSWLSEAKDYYDKDKNQDAYNDYVDYQNKLKYDLTAGQQKIDDLNMAISLKKNIDAIAHDAPLDDVVAYENILEAYGLTEDDDLEFVLGNEKNYYASAKEVHEAEELAQYVQGIMSRPDFAEKSQYKSTANGKERTYAMNGAVIETGYDDLDYDYINGNPDAVGVRTLSDTVSYASFIGTDHAEQREMYEQEIAVYNYLYATEGREAAKEFITQITADLNYRERKKQEEEARKRGEEHPISASIWTVVTSPLKGISYLGQLADYLDDGEIDQNAGYNKHSYMPTATRSAISDKIAASGKWGNVGSFLYNTGMSMGDFLVATGVSGGNGAIAMTIMGTGAAADTVISAKDRGLSDGQAFALGTVAGLAEAFTERVSLEALLNPNALADGAWKYILKNMLAEGSEETASSVINLFADVLISKDQSEWNQSILKYMNEGMTREEAFGAAFADQAESIGLDALGGMLSGGVMGGGGAVVNSVAMYNTKKTYGPYQGALVSKSLEIDPDNKFAQRMQSRIDAGKKLSGSQISYLVELNDTALYAQDKSAIQNAAKDALTKYGETGDVDVISEALAKKVAGEKLTWSEKKAISESKYGQRVANELNPENIKSGDYNTAWAESIGTNRINVNEYSRLAQDAEAQVSDPGKTAEVSTDVAEDAGTSTEVDGLKGEIAYLKEAVKNPNLTMDDRAAATQRLEEAEQQLKAVESGESTQSAPKKVKVTDNVAATPVTIEEASKKYGAQAKAMVATYNQGQNVAMFDSAYSVAYEMGKSDISMEYAMKSEATQYLTPEQREHAYKAGTAAADARTARLDKNSKASGKKGRRKGRVSADKGLKMADIRKALNDTRQNKAYNTLVAIAEATGINIVLTQSKVDAQGRLVGDQGQYEWDSDTIYIDINAGIKYAWDTREFAKYSMLRAFSHEFTHFLEKNAPTEYRALRKLVFAEMTARGENVDERIEAKKLEYKKENLSYEAASREVIAESMTDMLRDSSFVEKLTQKHQSIAQKILTKLKEFLADIKSYFAQLADNPSLDAKAIQQEVDGMMKYAESIIEAFDTAAVAAVENFNGIGSETTVAEVSEQIDSGIAEAMGPDGIALQTPDGSVAVVAKPSENGIDSVIVDSGAWDTQKSIRTYNEDILTDEDGNYISGKDLFRNLMKDNGFSDTDIDSAIKRMDSVIDVLTNDFAAFGKLQDNLKKGITTNILNNRQRVLFAMITNGDYPINGELSTTCVNRQAFQNMFEKLVESGIMKDVVFNSAAIAEMNAILRDHGYLTACFSCFVEARRVRVQEWAENFVSKWNEVAMKRGAQEQFGFFKNRENPKAMAKGDIFDIEEQLSQVDKNEKGNVALPQGNMKKRINALLDKVPSLTKLLTVEDIMSVGGLNAMRMFGEGGQNVFSLLRSSYGAASPKISQDFEAYGGDFAKMSFEYIKDILGKNIPGAQDLVRKIATQKTEATFEGKSYTKKAYSEEYSKNLNSAATKREALREYLYSIAGIRYQSFSDFDITQVFDKMQVFNDIAANRAPLHEYTKVISDIRIFGMTGGKMNASVIHQVDPSLGKENAGLVRLANGQLGYVADDRRHYEESGKKNPHRAPQSIDYADAVALMLDPRYSPNMGTIAIGFSDKHIEMMLDDNNIRMVIPYHRSGLPPLYMHLTGLSAVNAEGKSELIVQDYTDTQTASVKDLYDSKGKPVNQNSLTKKNRNMLREAAMSWKFAEHLNKNNGDPRKTAKEYLEWCASDHVFVTKDGKEFHFTVKPAFDQFSWHDNYYKVLIDFDPYDPVTNEIAKQGPVRISYAGDSAATTLDEKQLADYRKRLEDTNMYTSEQIDGYMRWAQQDLMDILREELSKEQKYIESTDAQEGPAFEKVSELLRTKYNRATYDENAVMAEHGIVAEKKSKETSYRQDTVLHESDFDQQNLGEEDIDSEDEHRVQYQARNYSKPSYKKISAQEYRQIQEDRMTKYGDRFGSMPNVDCTFAHDQFYIFENFDETRFGVLKVLNPEVNQKEIAAAMEVFESGNVQSLQDYRRRVENLRALAKRNKSDSSVHRDRRSGVGNVGLDDRHDRSGRNSDRIGLPEADSSDHEQHQLRTNTLTDHEILDMAAKELDTANLTDGERAALEIFRKKNDALKALKDERQKQGSLYYQYQFGDQKDTAKATAARNRMTVLDGKITKASAEVLGIEDKKVLKDVLQKSRKVIEQTERKASIERVKAAREETRAKERQKLEALRQKKNERIAEVRSEERQKAREKLDSLREKKNERIDEVRAEERERAAERVQTVREGYQSSRLREKIKAFKAKLEKNLLNPTERQYVPAGLTQAMIDVVNLIDIDTDLINEDGTINKAQERRNETKMKLSDLAAEYERLKASDPVYAGEFDEAVYNYLTELRDNFAGRHLSEMTLGELEEMYDILRSIEETLQDARKLIGWGDAEGIYEVADGIAAEQEAVRADRKNGDRGIIQKGRDGMLAKSLSPMRFVERMSGYAKDSYLYKLFRKLELGIRKANKFKMDAMKKFEHLRQGKVFDDAVYKEIGKTYTDDRGRKFRLTKMQMMQTILSYEREQANNMNHIENGGFTFANVKLLGKGKVKEAVAANNSHGVSGASAVAMVGDFIDLLKNDRWAQEFMETARQFFNGMAKDAVNEASLALRHRIIAKDKVYIPFEVDPNHIVKEIAAEVAQQTINSYGMLKSTVKGASNPLIITGLNNILDRHIDQVSNIHGLAVDIRNFNKVWNTKVGENDTVKKVLEDNWGVEGTGLIVQAVQDIQSPREDNQWYWYKKIKSNYIGAQFLLNGSVVFKQIGSLFSANAMIKWRGPVRQIGNLLYTMFANKKISAEVDKYTATAWMRRQGISDAELHSLMTEKKKTRIGRFFGRWPAIFRPTKWIAAMDHAVALSLWKYAKQDVAKRTGLKGEALLQAAAEFYDDVIESTQSMSDVLHRPEVQKGGGFVAETVGLFKTDLYQMSGQLCTAGERWFADKSWENANAFGKSIIAVLSSSSWGLAMTAFFALLRYKVNRYRDEEDKELTWESWWDRQWWAIGAEAAGYIFPILGGEIVGFAESLATGETDDLVQSIPIEAFNTAMAAIRTAVDSVKEDGELTWTDFRKFSAPILQMLGVPANNVLRTLDAIQLHAEDIANGEFLSFEAGAERSSSHHAHRIMESVQSGNMDLANILFDEAVEEMALKKALNRKDDTEVSLKDRKEAQSDLQAAFGKKYKDGKFSKEVAEKILIDLFGKSEDNAYWTIKKWDTGQTSDYAGVLDAVLSGTGFDEAVKEMTDHGYDQEEVIDKVKTQVKAWYTDEESEVRISKQEAMDMLKKYVGMKADEVTATINKWSSKVVTGIAYDDYKEQFMDGSMTASRAIDMRVRYGGKSREDAQKEVEGWNFEKKYGFSYSDRKNAYINGEVSASQLRTAMTTYGGMTAEEADENIRAYDWLKSHPKYDLSVSDVIAYTKPIADIGKSIEQTGITPDVYMKYKDLRSKCKGMDANGDGKTDSGSVKTEVLKAIDSLPISSSQKDALYYLNGWAKSKLWETPWH